MFVRSDVTGVRSSCDASATSWRWACDGVVERAARALERVEHRVEALRHPPDLVVAGDLDAPPEVLGLRDVLGGGRQLADGLDDLAAEQPPEERRAAASPAAHSSDEHELQPRERRVDVAQAARELDRAAVGAAGRSARAGARRRRAMSRSTARRAAARRVARSSPSTGTRRSLLGARAGRCRRAR